MLPSATATADAPTTPEEGRHQMSIEDGDHAEQLLNKLLLSLVARSVTPPSPPTSPREMMGEGGRHCSIYPPGSLSSVHLDPVHIGLSR